MYEDWLGLHYLDLSADEAARGGRAKRCCFVTSADFFERLEDEPSPDERILEAHLYTEPIAAWGPLTLLSGRHYFAVLETGRWWWSLERRGGAVIAQRARDFSGVQSRCQGEYRRFQYLQNGPALARGAGGGPSLRAVLERVRHDGAFDAARRVSSREFAECVLEMCAAPRGERPRATAPQSVRV